MARISSTQEEVWSGERDQGALQAEAGAGPTSARQRALGFLGSPYLTLISRFVLGGILLLSGLTKLGVPAEFAENIRAYEMSLPPVVVDAMAVGLPILEMLLGVWLIAGLFIRFSAIVSGAIMVVFLIGITQAWLRGLDVNCGCFAGEGGNPVGLAILGAMGPVGEWLGNEKAGPEAILRDVVLLLMAVHLFFVPTVFSLDNLRNRDRVIEEEE